MDGDRFLGVFVNPVYVQTEGLEQVFDNLESVGTKAVSTSPTVARPAQAVGGVRFPDLHVDGWKRLVARPVWGEREIYLERFLAYEPDMGLYAGGPYRPEGWPAPHGTDHGVIEGLVLEASRRGMQVHLQIHPFVPPRVRTEDQPQVVDGSTPRPPQVAMTACLNSPAAQTYALALVEDTVRHYPGIQGLFTDWAEYGAYRLEDHFTCLCPHCERKAREQGFDWEAIKRDVAVLWTWCHSLTTRGLARSRRMLYNPSELIELLTHHPGWLHLLQFKARTVVGFYRRVRTSLDAMGLEGVGLSARGWPPPWNRSTGMDYSALSATCSVIAPKLFTFDYSALPRWYAQTLLAWNLDLVESEVLDALVEWMQLPDRVEQRSFAHYHIPAPDELHPARLEAYRDRLDEVVGQVRGRAKCYPIAHAYLPEPQWKRMVALVRDSSVDGMWVQMYGYLSDRKLEILGRVWNRHH